MLYYYVFGKIREPGKAVAAATAKQRPLVATRRWWRMSSQSVSEAGEGPGVKSITISRDLFGTFRSAATLGVIRPYNRA